MHSDKALSITFIHHFLYFLDTFYSTQYTYAVLNIQGNGAATLYTAKTTVEIVKILEGTRLSYSKDILSCSPYIRDVCVVCREVFLTTVQQSLQSCCYGDGVGSNYFQQ